MGHWKASLWSKGHCVTLVSEKCYARTFVFAYCEFRFGALHLKIIALNFPPIIAPTAATPLLCTALPSCNLQNSFIYFTQQLQRGFFCLLVFPHPIWSPCYNLLTKCIKHLGRKKKKKKRCCFRLEMLWQFLSFNLNYTQQSRGRWCCVNYLKSPPVCCAWA